MTKWMKEKTQINKIKNEKEGILTDNEIQRNHYSTLKTYTQVNWKI
jgi:hypothetical protein